MTRMAQPLTDEQVRLVVQTAPVLMWRATAEGSRDWFNEPWLRFTGRSLDDEHGDGWLSNVHPDDARRCREAVRSLVSRRPFEIEYRLGCADGSWRLVMERAVPLSAHAHGNGGFIGTCLDVDERRELARSKASFIGLVAHEIRTPLTSMRALLEVVRRKTARSEQVGDELFTRLDQQVDVVADLTRDLSDVELRETGREIPLALAPLDLVELVREAVGTQLARRARQGVKVRYDLALPGSPLVMAGDRARLSQVVRQLLDNAAKFMPRGGVVEVRVAGDGTHHRLLVKDSGIGVSATDLPRVTDPYFRGGNIDADHYPGIGLGLTLARAVVEQHGGTMGFESTLHVGTTVEVRLPGQLARDAEVNGSATVR